MKEFEQKVLDEINEKIRQNLGALETLDKASDEYGNIIQNVNELIKAKKELTENVNSEKWKWIRIAVDILGIGIPEIVLAIFMRKGFKFEESGVYSSKTFGQLFKRIK